MKRTYPQLEIDLAVLRSNAQQVIHRCRAQNIRVCGVVKGDVYKRQKLYSSFSP